MSDAAILDGAFHFIVTEFVKSGQAPHYSELAGDLGCSVDEARDVLRELADGGNPIRLLADTDLIESVAPLSNVPTQYRITVEGEQKWYGQ